jgi:hypothetical protein
MRARATSAIFIRFISVLGLATAALGGCQHAGGKIAVDSTLLPYKAPDIDDITGIDTDPADAPDATATPAPAPAPAPAAGSAHAGGK